MVYVRFVIGRNDENSGRRQGLFQAISDLEHAGVLLAYEQQAYDEIYDWFRKNLKRPRKLARSTKPHAKRVALSWFKDSAREHISRMHALTQILHDHGVQVEVIFTERPGYVVYEDPYQVAAEPFTDTCA